MNEKYSPNDILNADKTDIFYNIKPDNILKFKGEKCVGDKLSKEHITAFVATNMSVTKNIITMKLANLKPPMF